MLALQQAPAPPAPWQQEVAYHIGARLDEAAGVLSGGERIEYHNASPDTLTSFSLHLYLNAFRPGSRWADVDSVEGRRRFNDLKDPDFAFNHVRDVRIMGQPAAPVYPLAPDSTIVRFALPRPLLPGQSMTVELNWDARPSTVPRRQGRQGRRFDFAQWYPKVVVYDRQGWEEHALMPAGEFYGEFGSFTVDLDLPEDEVMGATGVPVCGDPGWERANRAPDRAVEYQRDYYGATTPSADACAGAEPGRKRLRWYAERVHHFAMSLNPAYRYEGGRFGNVAVHVLYQPGDDSTWGGGIAVNRTRTALAWLDQLYGPFGWPQLTNVHRIEGGGTEFPMMIHDGSADQGLIVHEAGHNYTMGLLANNEWREGWLDEGFTSFQTSWFWETHGQGELRRDRGRGAPARPGRLQRAAQPGGAGLPRLHVVQHRHLHPGRAVLPAAPRHGRRRDDAPDPPDLLRPVQVPARGRGGLSVGGRGGVAARPVDLLRAVAAHDRAVRLRGRPGARAGATATGI